MIWDYGVLALYEFTGLFRIWFIFLALIIFLTVGYLMSRDFFWRYVSNRVTVELVGITLEVHGVDTLYSGWHRWVATWYPYLYWNALALLPAILLSAESRAQLTMLGVKRDYMPPNRRYLAALRSRIDTYIQSWQDSLLSLRALSWNPSSSGQGLGQMLSACQPMWSRIWAGLARDLYLWRDHHLVDCPSQRAIGETLFSSLLIAEEQMILCDYHRWITHGTLPPIQNELDSQIRWLLQQIGDSFGEMALEHYVAIRSLEPIASDDRSNGFTEDVLLTLSTLAKLLTNLQAVGPQSINYRWYQAISWQHVVWHMQKLIMVSHVQEAIQIYFEAEAIIGQGLSRSNEQGVGISAIAGKAKPREFSSQIADFFLEDVPRADPIWAVSMAMPSQDRWRSVLLAEAWRNQTGSLGSLFTSGNLDDDSTKQKRSLDLGTRVRKVRNGYTRYSRDESRGAAIACGHMEFEHSCATIGADE
jgi:hypothetical protein